MMRTFQFLAVVLTAIALVPAGAHLAELPNKIDMAQSVDEPALRGGFPDWIAALAARGINRAAGIQLPASGLTSISRILSS